MNQNIYSDSRAELYWAKKMMLRFSGRMRWTLCIILVSIFSIASVYLDALFLPAEVALAFNGQQIKQPKMINQEPKEKEVNDKREVDTEVEHLMFSSDIEPVTPAVTDDLLPGAWHLNADVITDSAAVREAELILKIPAGSSFRLKMDHDFLLNIVENSIVPLPLPGIGNKYEMYVQKINKQNGMATIVGHIDGYDVGYGVTITHGPDWIYAAILTPEGKFNIETVNGVTLMLESMKSFNSPGIKDDMPQRHSSDAG